MYLDDFADEGSSYVIAVVLRDENDFLAKPITLNWTLLDINDNVINSRDKVAIISPANENKIVLSGDDLVIIDESADCNYREEKKLVLRGTYDANDLGVLPVIAERRFWVHNIGGQ